MSRPERRANRSAYMRFALGYLLVMAVIFAGVSLYTFYAYRNAMRDEISVNALNKLNRLADQHERYLATLINTAEQLSISPYVKPFRFSDDPQKGYELMRQIAPYAITNDFCDQMFLYFRIDDTLYTSASTMKLDMFLSSLAQYENVSPAELRELLVGCDRVTLLPCQTIKSVLLDGGSCRMVTVIVPLGVNYKSADGTLLYMMKETAYRSLLHDAIDDATNTYILYPDGVLTADETLPLPRETVLAAVEAGQAQLRVDGADYLLYTVEGDSQGLRYIAALPASRVDRGAWSGLSRFFTLLAALLALCVPLIFFMTRKNYAPILELRDSLVSTDDKTNNAINDIQTGIQSLVGQNMALATRLDDSLPMQKTTFALDFMKGRYHTREEAILAGKAVGLAIDRRYMAVALSGASDKQVRPLDVSASPLGESGLIAGQGIDLIAYDQHLYLLFFDETQALDAFCRYLLEACKAKAKQLAVSVSNAYDDIQMISTAYLEAATAYDNRLVMGDERVLRFSDISIDVAEILPRSRNYSDAISQALRTGNRELIDQRITDLMLFLKRTSMSLFAFRLIYNDVIDRLLSGLGRHAANSMDALNYYNVFTLSSCHSVNDLDNLLRTLCQGIVEPAAQPDEQGAIQQVVAYISEHFTDPDLSMTAVADRFGISTAKLSMSFKELTQITPSDYLLMLRIEKAKELLSRTDQSIKDVSAAVGYYDSSGFIRRFKQYASMTPLQFRQSLQQGEKQ